jgi:hypothetical protein
VGPDEGGHPVGEQVEVRGAAGEVDGLADDVHGAAPHGAVRAQKPVLARRRLALRRVRPGKAVAQPSALSGAESGDAGREIGRHA